MPGARLHLTVLVTAAAIAPSISLSLYSSVCKGKSSMPNKKAAILSLTVQLSS